MNDHNCPSGPLKQVSGNALRNEVRKTWGKEHEHETCAAGHLYMNKASWAAFFLLVPNNIIGSTLALLINFVLLMQASEMKDWQHLRETGFGGGIHQASQPSYLY